ncbi:Hcp family type VI secretion system effector [Aestuariispira ectoiniformans]|uniref:Hcp family type VI secretion system effector n=1 Tax=Aestuariispira ectoiniformans TaxID=2775080 RepID=UPI00223AEA39|nr:Hcp family type VI secretion system effector [Aestuariispira ectoiniformans]
MPVQAYISIEGETQGLISQGATTFDSVTNEWQAGHEDEILVHAFDHAVVTPRDPQSGNPTGTRIHQPFKFTTSLNKAVPLMYNSLVTGELLPKVILNWYRVQASEQVNFFRTELEEALIVDINCAMPHVKNVDSKDYTQLVDVKMTYRKIIWEHVVAGTSGSDDWRAPVQS